MSAFPLFNKFSFAFLFSHSLNWALQVSFVCLSTDLLCSRAPYASCKEECTMTRTARRLLLLDCSWLVPLMELLIMFSTLKLSAWSFLRWTAVAYWSSGLWQWNFTVCVHCCIQVILLAHKLQQVHWRLPVQFLMLTWRGKKVHTVLAVWFIVVLFILLFVIF